MIYTGLCTLFASLIVLDNLTFQKFVNLNLGFHTFQLSVGAMFYPLTFLITDILAEFYGRDQARFCIRLGVLMNILVSLLIQGMDAVPATDWSHVNDAMFHQVFGFYTIAFLGSILACYAGQLTDIKLYLWIRELTQGRALWLRNFVSTGSGLFIDTLTVICFLSFFGALPKVAFWILLINTYSFKLLFSLVNIPIFYLCVMGVNRALRIRS